MPKRLIVVADQAIAHLFRASGRKVHQLLHSLENPFHNTHEPNSRHQGFSQPKSVTGHFFDPHMHQKNLEKESFAREIAHLVYATSLDQQVDELILVAEPKMLGYIRAGLEKSGRHLPPIHKCLSLSATQLKEQELEDKIFS